MVVFHSLVLLSQPVSAMSDVMLNHDGVDGICEYLLRALDVCEAAFQTVRNLNVGFAGNFI